MYDNKSILISCDDASFFISKEDIQYYDNNHELLLKEYIKQQLEEMAENIKNKKDDNFQKRKNNPFNCFNSEFSDNMGIGRSVDSQLGNRLQRIALFLSRLRFGVINVPNNIYLNINRYSGQIHVKTFSIFKDYKPVQNIYYCFDIGLLDQSNFIGPRTTQKIKDSGVAVRDCVFLCDEDVLNNVYKVFIERDENRRGIPVDLTFFLRTYDNIDNYSFELKAGGNLDTKNAQANVREVNSLKDLFSFTNYNEAYFATCYDSIGNGEPDGSILGELEREKILIGRKFWERILPQDITYERFVDIYRTAFYDVGVEEKILGK
ncbi:TdeIII family type II restriction endonuclease [Ruminococcus sp.]|jgi:hypothetical protein|uniref:TdeIII family type II restriction endonuclease n=1 Tax=Ruminococcus sp. TaxID=41978 RepID=UPI0025FC3B54|nr:TdeIII family type II restriction endonuclease [Ruminococcus sp.]